MPREFKSQQAAEAHLQQRRADFMDHMYKCSGRTNGLYTGLWQEFCLNEAGPYCQNMFFERRDAMQAYLEQEQQLKDAVVDAVKDVDLEGKEEFVTTLHD